MNLRLVWDFIARSVCKKKRYCCFSHSARVVTNGRGSVHETPLFPLLSLRFPSAYSPLFCLSFQAVSSNGRVLDRMYAMCSLSARIHMNVCFSGFCSHWCRINCGSHMCIETVWGPVVSSPPTPDFLLPPLVHLIIFPLPLATTALVPLYPPISLFIQLKMSY